MDDDRRRWDARYEGRPRAEPGAPSRLPLDLLPAGGRALDLACGRGAQAVWAAEQGFVVDAIDVSPVAVAATAALAAHRGVVVRALVADLDSGLPPELAGPYDLVICQRFRDPRLYAPIVGLLAPGGLAVVTVLSVVGRNGPPGPYLAAPGELRAALGGVEGCEVLVDHEGDGEATVVVRRRT